MNASPHSSKLSWLERALLKEITSLALKKGFCWASNGYFGKKFDCTPDWISRNISRLRKKQLIEVQIFPTQKNRRIIRVIPNHAQKDQNEKKWNSLFTTYRHSFYE